MKKPKYSMTAKERKALKEKEKLKTKAKPEPPPAGDETATTETVPADKKARKKRVLLVCIVCVIAAALIGTGIAVPIVVLNKNQSQIEGNPIATISLSNGKKLKMELFYDAAPGAVANFMYLSWSGYFDNTIFHDATNGFIGFAGFTEPTEIRAADERFVAGLKGFKEHKDNVFGAEDYKLGYRLKRENTAASYNEKGLLIFLAGTGTYGTSTHFLLTADANPQLNFAGVNVNIKSNISVMGRYIDEASIKLIDEIYAMDKVGKAEFNIWRYPLAYETIKIKSIKIANIGVDVKRKITRSFESVIDPKEDSLVLTWNTRPYLYSDKL